MENLKAECETIIKLLGNSNRIFFFILMHIFLSLKVIVTALGPLPLSLNFKKYLLLNFDLNYRFKEKKY